MKTQEARQLYIDWLRAGAMFLLVFYHSGRLFDEPGWHIKNAEFSLIIHIFNRFLDIWHMPLFFLLAGASVWFALGKRNTGGFAWERVLRLFVPLIFGMLVIVPPQVYTERAFDGDFTGSFIAWYPYAFQGGPYPEGNLSWHHLWFLAYLFTFSLILLPLFSYLRRKDKKHILSSLIGFLEKPGAIFLLAVPLIVYNLTLRPIYGYGNQNLINDWANFLFYGTVFFFGYLLFSDSRMMQTVQRNKLIALTIAIIGTLAIGLIKSGIFNAPFGWIIELTLYAITCWCWLIAIIAVGSTTLNFNNRLLKYSTEAVLPVYILHQTIIVVLGSHITQWQVSVGTKYFLVVIVTLLISLAIYELVRRLGVTRFMFGMKARKRIVRQEPATN